MIISVRKARAGKERRHLTDLLGRCAAVLVDQLAVSRDDTVNVFGRFHSSLDLKGSDTCIHQLGNVGGKAKILERKCVRIFRFIRQTAGLCAFSAVTASAADHGAHQALTRMTDAKSAVDKDLRFDRRFFAESLNIAQRQFSGRDHTLKADLRKRFCGKCILSRALRAGMERYPREKADQFLCKPDIRNNKGICAVGQKLLRKRDRLRKLRTVKLCIQNDIGFHTVKTTKRDRAPQFLVGKVTRILSGIERLRTEINRIRARGNRRFQSGGRPRRREKFGFHINNQKIFSEKSRFSAFLIKKIMFKD